MQIEFQTLSHNLEAGEDMYAVMAAIQSVVEKAAANVPDWFNADLKSPEMARMLRRWSVQLAEAADLCQGIDDAEC